MAKAGVVTSSDDELVAENQRLGNEIDAIRIRRLEIKRVLDGRDAARRAEHLLGGLDDVQIAAVAAAASTKTEG